MANNGYRTGVPDDWFVDPIKLGVPGVRQITPDDDENPLDADMIVVDEDRRLVAEKLIQ